MSTVVAARRRSEGDSNDDAAAVYYEATTEVTKTDDNTLVKFLNSDKLLTLWNPDAREFKRPDEYFNWVLTSQQRRLDDTLNFGRPIPGPDSARLTTSRREHLGRQQQAATVADRSALWEFVQCDSPDHLTLTVNPTSHTEERWTKVLNSAFTSSSTVLLHLTRPSQTAVAPTAFVCLRATGVPLPIGMLNLNNTMPLTYQSPALLEVVASMANVAHWQTPFVESKMDPYHRFTQPRDLLAQQISAMTHASRGQILADAMQDLITAHLSLLKNDLADLLFKDSYGQQRDWQPTSWANPARLLKPTGSDGPGDKSTLALPRNPANRWRALLLLYAHQWQLDNPDREPLIVSNVIWYVAPRGRLVQTIALNTVYEMTPVPITPTEVVIDDLCAIRRPDKDGDGPNTEATRRKLRHTILPSPEMPDLTVLLIHVDELLFIYAFSESLYKKYVAWYHRLGETTFNRLQTFVLDKLMDAFNGGLFADPTCDGIGLHIYQHDHKQLLQAVINSRYEPTPLDANGFPQTVFRDCVNYATEACDPKIYVPTDKSPYVDKETTRDTVNGGLTVIERDKLPDLTGKLVSSDRGT
jgi:hypothetical protein